MNRYRLNLLLFWAVLVLIIFWFYRHIHLYFRQTFFIGVPLSLTLLFELMRSKSKWLMNEKINEKTSSIKCLMASPTGTGYLLVALAFIAILLLTTSSVYFEYAGSERGVGEYEVAVEHRGQTYMRQLKVASYDRITGKPHFFGLSRLWNPFEVEIRITKPFSYAPERRILRPWSRVYLRIPADFDEKKRRVIRLLPNWDILQQPPRVDESDKSGISVEIIAPHDPNKVKYKSIDHILMETICFGPSKETIERIIENEPPEVRYIIMRNHLTKIGYDRNPDERARILASSYRCASGHVCELQPGQEFKIVFKEDVGTDEPRSVSEKQVKPIDILLG